MIESRKYRFQIFVSAEMLIDLKDITGKSLRTLPTWIIPCFMTLEYTDWYVPLPTPIPHLKRSKPRPVRQFLGTKDFRRVRWPLFRDVLVHVMCGDVRKSVAEQFRLYDNVIFHMSETKKPIGLSLQPLGQARESQTMNWVTRP